MGCSGGEVDEAQEVVNFTCFLQGFEADDIAALHEGRSHLHREARHGIAVCGDVFWQRHFSAPLQDLCVSREGHVAEGAGELKSSVPVSVQNLDGDVRVFQGFLEVLRPLDTAEAEKVGSLLYEGVRLRAGEPVEIDVQKWFPVSGFVQMFKSERRAGEMSLYAQCF